MQVETDEPEIVERIAALDVSKGEVVCRRPRHSARRRPRSCPLADMRTAR